jgi:hypothetical protein
VPDPPDALIAGQAESAPREREFHIGCWKNLVMANETPAGLLTVRELRRVLDDSHPDQVVIFALTSQDLEDLEAVLLTGLGISFAVKVDQVAANGPVFRLAPAGIQHMTGGPE